MTRFDEESGYDDDDDEEEEKIGKESLTGKV